MATPKGFEPSISTVTGWHVRPLHHGAALRRCTPEVAGAGASFGPFILVTVVEGVNLERPIEFVSRDAILNTVLWLASLPENA